MVAPASHAEPAGADDGPGIAILASAVDNGQSVEDLAAFVKAARVHDVVIDWAWITLHWDRTKFDRVNALVEKLKAMKVHVAAMYRPRFKAFQAKKYTIKAQLDAKGQLPNEREILYADPAARKWGTQWAVDILKKCPAFDEVVIYDPQQNDHSKASEAARKKDRLYDTNCVHKFLEETRKAMREVKKDAKLGLVRLPSEWAFKPYRDVVDVERPFAYVRKGVDYAKFMDHALEVMKHSKAAGPALATITWRPGEKVSDATLAKFIKTAREKKLRYCFWLFDTTFLEGKYDLESLCQAAGLDAAKLKPVIARLKPSSHPESSPEEVQLLIEDALANRQPLREIRRRWGDLAITALGRILEDKQRTVSERATVAHELASTLSGKAVEYLLRASRDESPFLRANCADALGWCGKGSKEARERLKEMAASDPATRIDTDGKKTWFVREAARESLGRLDLSDSTAEAAFFKSMPWSGTLEDALAQAKREGKLVALFINPFNALTYDCGYREAKAYTDKLRAGGDPLPAVDVGLIKERAMLAGLLAEPRNAAFITQRCVPVRMRLSYKHWTDYYDDEPHALKAIGMDDKAARGPAVLMISPQGKVVAHAHDLTFYCPELFRKIAATALAASDLKTPSALKKAQDALAAADNADNYLGLLNALLDAGEFEAFRKFAANPPKPAADETALLSAEADLLECKADAAADTLSKLKNAGLRTRRNALLAEALVRLDRVDEAAGLRGKGSSGTPDTWQRRLQFFNALAKDRLGNPAGRAAMADLDDDGDPWCVRAALYGTRFGPNPDEWCPFSNLALPEVLRSTEAARNGTAAPEAIVPAIRKAAEYLVSRQRADGAWEGSGTGKPAPDGLSYLDTYVVARTALATCALDEAMPTLDRPLAVRAKKAVERGLKYIRDWRPVGRVYEATYALYAELKFYDELRRNEKPAANERIGKLLEALKGIEHDGGWTYIGAERGRFHTFNTAPILIDLAMLREMKLANVDDMIERAQKFLERLRVGKLALFYYGTTVRWATEKDRKYGSMRSALCELALLKSGAKAEREKRLGESIDLFFKHIDSVRNLAKRWESFFNPGVGHDSYHYYFGTWYASQAILELPDRGRIKSDCEKLANKLLLTQEIDGGYCDGQTSVGRSAATAMALMTLVNCKKGRE